MGQAQQQTGQFATVAEQVSALMDGEVADRELDAAIAAAKTEVGAVDWQMYQLIGDALRSEDLLRADSSQAFMQTFSARFEAEPHVLVPSAPHASRHRLFVRPSWVRRVVPATAVAAAVAAVTWVAVPQLLPTTNPNGETTVVAMAPAASDKASRPSIIAVSNDTAMIRDARLDDYLRAHRQAATAGVAMPGVTTSYIRAAVAPSTQAQDNTQE